MPANPTTLVMHERPPDNPRPTFIHNRGEYLQPTDRVQPAVLSILPPLPKDVAPNRLALARWLVSPDNPLSARVTMNRQWAAFFGRGLVRTAEDFGYQGEPPTHPELLDWLALELPRQGWSMKRMHKLIVMSATYQQSSRVTPELLAKDPENRLLARGPRVRLEAEVIRDAALRVSGLLSERIGGPSVFPPQPRRRHDRGDLRRPRLEGQPGRRPLSPRALHVHQAHRPVRHGDDLRRAQRRSLRRPARGVQYAAPGADAPERPGLRGGRAGARAD